MKKRYAMLFFMSLIPFEAALANNVMRAWRFLGVMFRDKAWKY